MIDQGSIQRFMPQVREHALGVIDEGNKRKFSRSKPEVSSAEKRDNDDSVIPQTKKLITMPPAPRDADWKRILQWLFELDVAPIFPEISLTVCTCGDRAS